MQGHGDGVDPNIHPLHQCEQRQRNGKQRHQRLREAHHFQPVVTVDERSEDRQEYDDSNGVDEGDGAEPPVGVGEFPREPLYADALNPDSDIGEKCRI